MAETAVFDPAIDLASYKKERARLRANYRTGKCRGKHHRNLRAVFRARLREAIHACKGDVCPRKETIDSLEQQLGCSIPEFKAHIEQKFKPGMSWDNYGNKPFCWSIDHILPLGWFNLRDEQQAQRANHYTNLQPLWHLQNVKKNSRF